MKKCIQVTTTVETRQDAENLAQIVLERRLAACVQISSCISMYHWQGTVEQTGELKLVMKSFADLYPQLEQLILEHHPYDTPEILALPIQFAGSGYLDWMIAELKQE